jgi:hypothetical protein
MKLMLSRCRAEVIPFSKKRVAANCEHMFESFLLFDETLPISHIGRCKTWCSLTLHKIACVVKSAFRLGPVLDFGIRAAHREYSLPHSLHAYGQEWQ